MATPKSPRRTSFLFPKDAAARLKTIRHRTFLEDDADVIRLALSLLDVLLEVAECGFKIAVRDASGKDWLFSPYRPLSYPGLHSATAADANAPNADAAPRNFFFSGEAVERLDSIRSRSELGANSDVIRYALAAFDQLLTVDIAGDDIVIKDHQKREYLLNIFNPRAWRLSAILRETRSAEAV